MEKERQLKLIAAYIHKMPSLPTSVTKVVEICNNPNTSPADLNKVISIDPVLMGNVMKLINSAYYGLSQQVTSLVRAIIMLGLNTVKNLALSTAILGNLSNKKSFQAINMEGFWRHSLCVGVTSKLIAKHIHVDTKSLENYFIAGLLHDIGKIPLNHKFAQEYITAISYADRDQQPLYKGETEAIGINHAEAGQLVARAWKLGDEISDAIIYHHSAESYDGKHENIVFAVSAANFFSNYFEIGFSGDRYPEKLAKQILQNLDIDMDWFDEIEDTVTEEIEKARIFLKLSK